MNFLIGIILAALISGCCSAPVKPNVAQDCGTLDTEAVRKDVLNNYRTDPIWYNTVILKLTWQLDCERNNGRK